MEKSENISRLVQSLIQVQTALGPAVKDKTNPLLKSKYADFSGVWEACRHLLQENNLAVLQVCSMDAGGVFLETILAHESGEWISGRYPLRPARIDDPQAMGSALNYARRYTVAAMLGIGTEDDYADEAMARKAALAPQNPAHPPVWKPATLDQLNRLDALKKAGKNIKSLVTAHKWKVAKLSDLSFEQAAKLLQDLAPL